MDIARQNLNQGNSNLEEFTQLLVIMSTHLDEISALNTLLPEIPNAELESNLRLIIAKLDLLIATSVVSKEMMQVILVKWLETLGGKRL